MGVSETRTLFAIGADLEALERLITEAEGDISDPKADAAVQTWIDDLDNEIAAKVDAFLWLFRKWESEQAVAEAERDRMTALARNRANRIERLKTLLRRWMERHQRNELVSATGRTIRLACNGGKRPLVYDQDTVSFIVDNAYGTISFDLMALERIAGNGYLEVVKQFMTCEIRFDNEKVRQYLEAGGSLPFAELGASGKSLRLPK